MKSGNEYTKHIKRIQFSITYACNSRCRHCGVIHRNAVPQMEKEIAVGLVREMAKSYEMESVMTFGGEPLMCLDVVEAVHKAATEAGIPKRQLMTNGGFWEEVMEMERQVDAILSCGINRVLLSVDTFHMEFIPLIRQHIFAQHLKNRGFTGLRLNPLWVVSRENENIFNMETKECLKIFADLDIPEREGNVLRPEGNVKRYLERCYKPGEFGEAFRCGDAPYTERLDRPTVISVAPGGDVTICGFPIGNVYKKNIREILDEYDPYQIPIPAALLRGGIPELLHYMEGLGFEINLSDYYTPCEFCHEMRKLHEMK